MKAYGEGPNPRDTGVLQLKKLRTPPRQQSALVGRRHHASDATKALRTIWWTAERPSSRRGVGEVDHQARRFVARVKRRATIV
jgi:hypothetical protein